jgi:hypothetical protein
VSAGALVASFYGLPRTTTDIDVVVEVARKVVTVDYGDDVGDLFVRERGSHRNNRHNNPLTLRLLLVDH